MSRMRLASLGLLACLSAVLCLLVKEQQPISEPTAATTSMNAEVQGHRRLPTAQQCREKPSRPGCKNGKPVDDSNNDATDEVEDEPSIDNAAFDDTDINNYNENPDSGMLYRRRRKKAFQAFLKSGSTMAKENDYLKQWGRPKEDDADYEYFQREFRRRKAAKEYKEKHGAYVPETEPYWETQWKQDRVDEQQQDLKMIQYNKASLKKMKDDNAARKIKLKKLQEAQKARGVGGDPDMKYQDEINLLKQDYNDAKKKIKKKAEMNRLEKEVYNEDWNGAPKKKRDALYHRSESRDDKRPKYKPTPAELEVMKMDQDFDNYLEDRRKGKDQVEYDNYIGLQESFAWVKDPVKFKQKMDDINEQYIQTTMEDPQFKKAVADKVKDKLNAGLEDFAHALG